MTLLEPLLDLGELPTAPMLIFGGPYSNLQALRRLRAIASERRIPPSQVLCTGDIVAYCADPSACLDEIRDWGCHTVMGNCEESLAEGADDCGCGFESGTACDALSAGWFRFASARVTSAQRQWMNQLPRRIAFRLNGVRVGALHGGAFRINRFVYASRDHESMELERAACGWQVVLGGHGGIPFVHPLPGGLWVNAGAIGMPANDGTPDGWFALLEPMGQGHLRVHLERLVYPWSEALTRMRAEGLDTPYATCLGSGLWPSLDVLPAAERSLTGQPLSFTPQVYCG